MTGKNIPYCHINPLNKVILLVRKITEEVFTILNDSKRQNNVFRIPFLYIL
jgi:hypothetical protein